MSLHPPNLDTDELLPDLRRTLVPSVIACEADSPICTRAATRLRQTLVNVEPALGEVLNPFPLRGGLRELPHWLDTACSHRLLQHLPESLPGSWTASWNCRLDNERVPQCVLILPSTRLTDPIGRDELVQCLMPTAGRFAPYLLLLLDDQRQLLEPGTRRETLTLWAKAFVGVTELSRVCLCLVSSIQHSGESVPPEELADAVALALSAEIILPSSQSSRVLTGGTAEASVSLLTFGLHALQFSADETADRFAERAARELLDRVQYASGAAGQAPRQNLPRPAAEILAEAFPNNLEFNARARIAGRGGEDAVQKCPVLLGPNCNFTVDMGEWPKA